MCAGKTIATFCQDDLRKRGKQDRDRINVEEDYEGRDWAKSLGVSECELQSAVGKGRHDVKDVKADLQLGDWLCKPAARPVGISWLFTVPFLNCGEAFLAALY